NESVRSELFHGTVIENYRSTAQFFQNKSRTCKLLRVKNIGRLIEEITRREDAVRNRRSWVECFADRRDITDVDRHVARLGRLLVILAFRLVSVERISAQPHALRESGRLFRSHRPARHFRKDSRITRGIRKSANG